MKPSILGHTRRPTRTSRRATKRTAAVTVEMALVLPFLLLLFVAGVDFARVYYDAQVIADCARAGALYAANPDLADRTGYETVEQATLVGATDLTPQPTVTVTNGTDELDHQYVEVAVSHTFTMVSGFVRPSQIHITRKSRARLYPAALE